MKAEKVVLGCDPVANRDTFGSKRSECDNFSQKFRLGALSYDPLQSK